MNTELEQHIGAWAHTLEHLEELLNIDDYDDLPEDVSAGALELLGELDVSDPVESAGEIFYAFIESHVLEIWSDERHYVGGSDATLLGYGFTLTIGGPTIRAEFMENGSGWVTVTGTWGTSKDSANVSVPLVAEHLEALLGEALA